MPRFAATHPNGKLLPDHVVRELVAAIDPVQRLFLAGLGRGLPPGEAARRAGWDEGRANWMAEIYMGSHPIVRHLAAHILRLRELAAMDGEAPVLQGMSSVQ